jgi:hypothetical protein
MKSLLRLLTTILEDSRRWCDVSTTRDLETIARRTKHEGLSFLMITLPDFCADFERSLAEGRIVPSGFRSFSKHRALPRFLGGLLERVFDRCTGTLLDSPDISSIFFIRQICLAIKKMEETCSPERVNKAFRRYIETNGSCREWELDHLHEFKDLWSGSDLPLFAQGDLSTEMHRFKAVSAVLWGSVIKEDSFLPENLIPGHGPGATAERISGNGKYALKSWHWRLDDCFPFYDFCVANLNYADDYKDLQLLPPGAETPVRVITVPKTLKTPRIIAIEPVCMQYTQQAVLHNLVPILEDKKLHDAIGFTDQLPNQQLATKGSLDGSLATIDLKDASDRVPAQLVWEMLECLPYFRKVVFSCRSLRADVPGYGLLDLSRFASMGSALCFPIEAMVFLTIVVSGILGAKGTRVTKNSVFQVLRDVRVYGDDIIVPVEYTSVVTRELEWFNLQVNANKTFEQGKFRESCGWDVYDGVRVTPVYLRRAFPKLRTDAAELLSTISFRNQCYENGMWKTASYLDEIIERIAPFPDVQDTSPIVGRKTFLPLKHESSRFCPNLHVPLVKGIVVSLKKRISIIDGSLALLKFFLKRGRDPFFDKNHLRYSGRPVSVNTRTRWATPF